VRLPFGVFSVTMVDLSKAPIDGDVAIDQAARTFTRAGAVQMDVPSRTGNPPFNHRAFGRELDIVRPDGSESMAQVFIVRRRLYIAEGRALPPDAANHTLETIRFEESIIFPRTPADDAGGGVMAIIPPAPAPDKPISVSVKTPNGALTETWRWSPGGDGRVRYCRQEGRAAETCAAADNPDQGDHMPATQTAPFISSIEPGMAWLSVGGTVYFCKHTTYKKGDPLETTCVQGSKGGLPQGTPIMVQAVADQSARFFLMPGYRSFLCHHAFPAPDGDPSQVALMCQVL
jgi:hypothetical protein